MDNVRKWRTPVLIAFLLLGILISVQYRTQQVYLNDLSLQPTDNLIQILSNLHDKRDTLEKEQQYLEQQQQALNNDSASGANLVNSLHKESEQLEIALGLIPVKGPGITVTIPPDSPLVYLDLVDITNELWASQAEAVAINDQRLTAWTTIFWDREQMVITVNGKEIAFPCTIKAIGNPQQLQSGLQMVGGVLDDLAVYKIYPQVKQEQNLELPGAAPPVLNYIQPVPATPAATSPAAPAASSPAAAPASQ
jgi:uncharacterized protein YlxW (UPF0749 family)